MKKLTAILTAFLLFLTISGCSQSSGKRTPKDDIYIFYTGDVHCGVEENLGFAALKAMVEDTRAMHENVLLVDSGDYIQGGTIGALSKGSIVIRLMNAMGYDVATIGNHEFDYGMEELAERMKEAEFDIVASNVLYTGNQTNIFADTPAYVIKEIAGVKIAFVGILTPESIISSTPANFMEDDEFVYDFYPGNDGMDLAEQVQKAVDSARKEGADYVIALSHLGSTIYETPYDSISLIHHTTGIDAVLDGHSHSVIIGDTYPNAKGEDVLLMSTGTKLANAGQLMILTDGTISSMLVSEYGRQDESITAAVTEANEELGRILARKISDLDFDMPIADENGIRLCRSREVTPGNFCADAVRYAMDTDVAVVNGGGVRHALSSGEITYENLMDIMPFQNTLGSCRCTGQQILDALEFGAQHTEPITSLDGNAVGEFGGFLQVSGLKYTIDTSVSPEIVLDENKMLVSIEGERRVKDVYVLQNGEYIPLDPAGTYTVGSSSYILFNNGDGNTAFSGAEVIIKEGMTDVEGLIRYLQAMGSMPDTYRQTEGRITVQ